MLPHSILVGVLVASCPLKQLVLHVLLSSCFGEMSLNKRSILNLNDLQRKDCKEMSREGQNLVKKVITQIHKGLRVFQSRLNKSTYLGNLVKQLVVLLSLLQRAQVTAHLAVAGPPTDLWQ